MNSLRARMVKVWESARAWKPVQILIGTVRKGIRLLLKVWGAIVAMLQPLWVRREMVLVLAVYVMATLIILFLMPGHWRDFPASWQTKLSYVAKKDLDTNYRLTEADLGRPGAVRGGWGWFLPDRSRLIGKYVKSSIRSGEEIDTEIVKNQPELKAGAGFSLAVFPLDKQKNLCSLLNAGSYVDIADSATVIVSGVRVSAITAPPGVDISQSCFAILEADRRDEPKLAPDKLATFHLVVRDFQPRDFFVAEARICKLQPGAHVDVVHSEQVFISEARVHSINPASPIAGANTPAGCVAVLEVEREKSQSSLWSQQGALHLVPRDFALVKFANQKGSVCELPIGSLVDVMNDKDRLISGLRRHAKESALASPPETKAPPSGSDKKAPPGTSEKKSPPNTSHQDQKEQSCSEEVEVPYEKDALIAADQIAKLHIEKSK